CRLDVLGWSAACERQRHENVHALAVAPQVGIAAAAEANGGVRVFRAASAEIAFIRPPPTDVKQVATGVALSEDGQRVAVTAHDGTVRVYSVGDQRLLN